MMKSRTPWKVKMLKPATFIIEEGPANWNEKYGGTRMVIPTPKIIEQILYGIREGKVMTLSQLREHIADQCKGDYACPLTTGIFLRICSEYAEEIRKEGAKKIPPYWRVVRDDGSLIDKFPGGIEAQMKILKSEGIKFTITGIRKKKEVVDL